MSKVAFVFDIDGVLIRGGRPIAAATKALRTLNRKSVPFMLLTNGGGVTEAARTKYLSGLLDVELKPSQLVQSHTPFRLLADKFPNILAVGGAADFARDVALSYGFRNVVRPVDIIRKDHSVWPFHMYSDQQLEAWSRPLQHEKLDAVMVFNDPRDMGSDLQVILDVLLSENGHLGTAAASHTSTPSVPIYFSNNDLLWANENRFSRLGQGAFRLAVEAVYKEVTGHVLHDTIIGKPSRIAYRYVDQALNNHVTGLWHNFAWDSPVESVLDKVVMVGDNPASDIAGAAAYGWSSCLVRTGVYKDGDNLAVKPTWIVDDVYEAVMRGLNDVE